jgi:transcriptional regulator with XRE-family HTH domain
MVEELIEFSEWLRDQLECREWKAADLARCAAIDKAVVSRILNSARNPGPDTCVAIAHALEIPEEEVFRQAGYLSRRSSEPQGLSELMQIYSNSPEEDQVDLLEYARFRRIQRQRIDLKQRLIEQLQNSRRG